MVGFRVIISTIFAATSAAAAGRSFGYQGVNGPENWGQEYNQQCLGKHQSPINIDSAHVTRVILPPLKMYDFEYTSGDATLTNNGHTAMMTMTTDSKIKPIISGGPLDGEYIFAQLHFHWGSEDAIGSEDEIDGKSYPMEMHIVFFKKEYSNFGAALAHSDGLCVLACFFEPDGFHNDNYNGFGEVLPNIIKPDTSATFKVAPALFDLIPLDTTHYFTYNGSLTIPPCAEVVTWIDFQYPIKLSHDQFASFRCLLNEEQQPMSNNFRAVQPLGDRVVLYNTDSYEGLLDQVNDDEALLADIEELIGDAETLVLKLRKWKMTLKT